MNLSNQQKLAVEYIGSPTLVVAGAGSGKTRTLTSKIAFLIQKGFDPERILAITFTNRAAIEMKERLLKETHIKAERFKWVRTYHSACYMIVKSHYKKLGFNYSPQIFIPYHQEKLLKNILIKLHLEEKKAGEFLNLISMAKNSGEPISYFNNLTIRYPVQLKDIFKEYEKGLKQNEAIDFDNILLFARDLLRDYQDLKTFYQDLFQFILVDEYQDTNNLQEEITGLLVKNGNIFCVGDDWQSVYGFRGSNLNHFLSFKKKYKNSKIFLLEENYRSTNLIVKTANTLISNNENKIDKKCFSEKKGGKIEVKKFINEYEESNFVAKEVKRLRQEYGFDYKDFAVIYRTKFVSLNFEKALRYENIPYQLKGAKGFFERKEILDIVSYLLSAAFPKDEPSFERIINIPKRGVGEKQVEKLILIKENLSLREITEKCLKENYFNEKIQNELEILINALKKIETLSAFDAINFVLKDLDYLSYIEDYAEKSKTDFTTKKENIDQLLFSAKHKPLKEFLEEISLLKEDTEEEDDDELDKNAVSLITAHSSKGLEYEVVFIVACEEELFPHWKCNNDYGLPEERRLMYVAMTRAKKFLFLTHSLSRKDKFCERSRFLSEILKVKTMKS